MSFNPFVRCVCPSCFEEIYLGECEIVSGRTTGKSLKKAVKGPFARMHVEPLDGRKYTLEMAHRKCTECGYNLPYNIELVPSFMLVVVGDTFSGKSHYIAALIHQLKEEWISNANGLARITCLTPDIEQKYVQDYFEPLFIDKKELLFTKPATKTTAEPLIYKLVISQSAKHPPTSLNLMVYDTSGEDFRAERLVHFARFVLNTSAFIFVADPFTMAPITSKLPVALQTRLQQVFSIAQRRRAADGLNNTIDIFERYRRRPDGGRLPDTPVAIMLSKADLLKYLNPAQTYTFMKNPQYGGDLNLKDINAVDEEVRGLLVQYKQGDLLAAINRFKHVKFFATSATGEPPDANGTFTNVEPCRCPDPVLWILHRLGVVKGR